MKDLQAGISKLYYKLTSSRIIYRDFDQMDTFQWFFSFLYKILEMYP